MCCLTPTETRHIYQGSDLQRSLRIRGVRNVSVRHLSLKFCEQSSERFPWKQCIIPSPRLRSMANTAVLLNGFQCVDRQIKVRVIEGCAAAFLMRSGLIFPCCADALGSICRYRWRSRAFRRGVGEEEDLLLRWACPEEAERSREITRE